MRILVQRVSHASVTVDDETVGTIGAGLVLLIGIGADDTGDVVRPMCEKIANLRIFEDDSGRMQLSALDLRDAGARPGVLAVSQFTLYGDVRKGRRPSYSHAASPDVAAPMVDACAGWFRDAGFDVGTGQFGAHMHVSLTNDGPVTIWIDSDELQRPRKE